MRRNSSQSSRKNSYYNLPLLHWFRSNAGLTVHGTAVAIGMNRDTARKVFLGKASHKQVWKVARYFKINWSLLHDLDLPPTEFDRAVMNGNSESVRSSRPGAVGVRRVRPVERGQLIHQH